MTERGPALWVISYYFSLFAVIGLLMPYMPVHFLSLGLSGAQIGVISSVGPLATVFMPPIWGLLADRTGRIAALLAASTTMWALLISPMLVARTFGAVLVVATAQSLFGPSLSVLADALAVVAARKAGTDYARLRLWGSVGFIASSFSFGQALARGVAPSVVIPVALAVALVAALLSWAAPRLEASGHAPPSLADAVGLLRDRRLLLFLLAAMAHWAAFSPFNLFLSPHLERVTGSKAYVGACFSLAVGAEIVGMLAFRWLRERVSLLALIAAGCLANALRWALVASLSSGPLLVAVQAIHGVSFGIFFVSSVAYLEKVVPPALRATGRSLFSAISFGLGGILGHTLSGNLFDRVGSAGAFRAAVVLELVALAFCAALAAQGAEAEAGDRSP